LDEDFSDLTRLIRSLQRREGHAPCFGLAGRPCGQSGCTWQTYCRRKDLQPEVKTPWKKERTDGIR
jgi:hypothetical protein